MKSGLPFAFDLSFENSEGSDLCFRLTLFHLVPYTAWNIYIYYDNLIDKIASEFLHKAEDSER